MKKLIGKWPHGRETYAVDYGEHVLKRPLPTMGPAACDAWLAKQHKTKEAIDSIRGIGNPTYYVPSMLYINDQEYQILEERASGTPLTRDVFSSLTRRQKVEIVNGIAGFLVDMNESRPVMSICRHKISEELKFSRLDNFINDKMSHWFAINEIKYMARIRNEIGDFEYETRPAWSHCDLNPGNVFYDVEKSKLSFIDFAEANYRFIYRDIFSVLAMELGIYRRVYEEYTKLHDKSLYPIPSIKNENLRSIMKYRLMIVLLRRFIKASDDLRKNPRDEKSANNNLQKIQFMREMILRMQALEAQF